MSTTRLAAGRAVGLVLAWLLLVAAGAAAAAARPPVAVAGRIEVAADQEQPIALQGQWGFAWQQFVDPAWERLPTTAFAPVPSSWNEVSAGGKPPGPNGWGSYVLLVDCPPGRSLAIEALGQRTASRLFINGTPVATHGVPGSDPARSGAAVSNRVPITSEFACPLRVTLHVSNFDHRAGGFVRPLVLGAAERLQTQRESRVIYDAALLSAYLLTGVLALIFFAVRRRERVPLVFGLFCIAMAIYTDMIAERLFLRLLPAQISWRAYMRVEYLSWIAAMGLFLLTLRGLFPSEIRRRVVQGVEATLGLAAVAVVVLPPGVYSYLAQPGQFIAVVVGVYIAWTMIRAQRRAPGDARVLLAGMLAILLALAIDLLLIDVPGPDRKFAPIGFALFMLSPAVVIARRLTQALNAEERNRTLEENARLREDVERISRHDLKTPLNSILGATRLLADETSLTQEQRELVGVAQRAGLRMLEMVNLSLGLFRMETGTYPFRPQAVDLRDVVTRVLVDLHAFAEANAVTLHLQASRAASVPVRGEELLCYSIVANLVKNAVEAARPGRQVSIALERGDPVRLTVHNPGAVAAAVAPRFFEKYVTAGKLGGVGLGTYSARLMARVQQGDLQMRTDAAHGTTLTLTLKPPRDEALAASPTVPTPLPAAPWTSDMPPRTVLLVDDDEYTRLVTRRFLPSPPFAVETAANGQAVVAAMTIRWPHYLLIDMEMPVMNGLETVRRVREFERAQGRPHCHVVMLSGNDDEGSVARALQAGADRFLAKPVSRESLLATLRELEGEPAPATAATSAAGTVAGVPDLASSPEDERVAVDPAWLDAFPGFVRSQRETVAAMSRALEAGDREQVKFLAHRAFGGLSLMGLQWAARQCRQLEYGAMDAPVTELAQRVAALSGHLGRLRIESA